ncbi:uncharacterized protein [Gossypium hirsutum]|uniref:RNase H type-1 domain-containing protein n=1 Tax=Gossypium hirsutum TaxID=3635 RepID=A0A1U8NTV9_GOSHI|nr:uncharacterized protein LOC107951753 [Gossypium hirsutum]
MARAILTFCSLDGRLINNDYNYYIDWIEESIRLLDKKAIVDFITTLWNSWNNRNNFIFRGKEEYARVIWERDITLSKDFHIHNMVNKLMPLRGIVKINFDAAVSNTKTGFGVIARDSEGFFIGGGFGFKNEEMTSDWTELYAFEESLKIARLLNVTKATLETDCTTLTNRIKKRRDDISLMGYLINNFLQNMDRFNNVVVNWDNRNCNKVADFLSNYAIPNEGYLVFGMDYPTVIHNLVIDDVIN